MFTVIVTIASFLILWFRSEAFIEYSRLFRCSWLCNYKDYDAKKKNDASLSYFGYLRQYHNNFFTRLITCPVCLCGWLAFLAALWYDLLLLPFFFVGGLVVFGLVNWLLG